MTDDDAIVPLAALVVDQEARAEVERPDDDVQIGQWFWVNPDNAKTRWFGCAVHIGSNYVQVQNVNGGSARVALAGFDDTCRLEPNPEKVIADNIRQHQAEVAGLMREVEGVTARLAVSSSLALGGGAEETQALAVRNAGQPDMASYGKDLVKAKEKTLPELFSKIEDANRGMASWMTAQTLPLKAKANGLKTVVERINDRIFSVELYAGLTEQIEQIADGAPAELTEKIRLVQRLHYMDEECLAHYETGGMEFKNLEEFDAWLTRPDNLARLLPFPRCVVSFKVRREKKEREVVNLGQLPRVVAEEELDKYTFLYIKNGARVFRMRTGLEFGPKLFPDMSQVQLNGKLWAEEVHGRYTRLITDLEHSAIMAEFNAEKAEALVQRARFEAALKTPEAKGRAKAKYLSRPDWTCVDVPSPREPYMSETYVPYDKTHVNYDDITKRIAKDLRQHNRIALILQGLLDRSLVLHPHPPWRIWTAEGFATALDLIYDETRALTTGEVPDFEAYRARLNASLKPGSVTVGQDSIWAAHEAEKEGERRRYDPRFKGEWYGRKYWRPDGNPGPGVLARITAVSRKQGVSSCSWAWYRTSRNDGELRTTFTCPTGKILNVDAYTPGDFRIFFADPRTRAQYIKWAPMLLAAEEYHTGKYPVLPPAAVGPKKGSSWEGKRRYAEGRRRKLLRGKAVRLVHQIRTRGGTVFEKGSLWRISHFDKGYDLFGILPDGTTEVNTAGYRTRSVGGVDLRDFEVDLSIPPEPPEPKRVRPVQPSEPEEDALEENDPVEEEEDEPEEDTDEPEDGNEEAILPDDFSDDVE